jgi:hypothetical protein
MARMRYRFMNEQDFYDIYRRWKAGQNISEIAEQERRDRKTIRPVIQTFIKNGIDKTGEMLSREEFFKKYRFVKPSKEQNKAHKACVLEDFKEELTELINHPKDGMKPKTAFEVVSLRHNLKISYSSFKRFSRKHNLRASCEEIKETIRIETEAGEEIQLDYGKVGLLDYGDKKKTVQAFIGTLSHSRLPFVQFVFSQNQESFVESNIDMLEFYGGAPVRLSLDNLKSGVITADLYDPKLNQAYSEFAEYYGVFVDPCRAGKPKDKGKVERMVPVARELFRKLKALYPSSSLKELNLKTIEWSRQQYGMRDHGTTGMKPLEVFETIEKAVLKKLPSERLVTPIWKKAKVHPDQFVQFEKKRYSLPAKYRGEEVLVRRTGQLVKIFYRYELIREFTVPRDNAAYEKTDFPEHTREMLGGGYPKYILDQSRQYGEAAYQLVLQILSVHANLNCRRALGFLKVMEESSKKEYFSAVCEKAKSAKITDPKLFRFWMNEKEKNANQPGLFEISEKGSAMIRAVDYYFY